MNKIFYLIIVLSLAPVFPAAVYAHGGIEESLARYDKPRDNPKPPRTTKGRMIEMSCYLKRDVQGADHKDCARECAVQGHPLGLLTKDGKLFMLTGKEHENLKEVNQKLLDYIEYDVEISGEVFEKHDTSMIEVESVTKLWSLNNINPFGR